MSLTTAEENYLKSIFKISERKGTPVTTNAIAAELATSAASVTDMLKKLSAKDLVHYEKYRGVHLTGDGTRLATQLIRNHRLWETFLVDKLDFSWGEVHEVAEQLEHIQSAKLIERLDEFLGYPRFDPHGDPIPDSQGKFVYRKQHLLEDLQPGESGAVVGVQNHDTSFLDYLTEFDLKLGSKIQVIEHLSLAASLRISINNGSPVPISPLISKNVYVKKA